MRRTNGAGMADGLCSQILGEPGVSIAERRKIQINVIKNQCLIDTFDEHSVLLESQGLDAGELRKIMADFSHSLSKGIGPQSQRKTVTEDFVKKLQGLGVVTSDMRLIGGSPSTSEDELTVTKRELKSERIAREEALVGASLDRIAKEEALHRERSATLRADEAIAENKKLKAELQALKKARVDVSEDD